MSEEEKHSFHRASGMGHSYVIMGKGNLSTTREEEQRIRTKIDNQSNKTLPLFSLEYYLNSAIDIKKRNGPQLDDWNDIAKTKSLYTGISPIEERIKNNEIIPVTIFNLSKHFRLYQQPESARLYIHETIEELGKTHGLDYVFENFNNEINKINPLIKIYSDMKKNGIEAHFSHDPDLCKKENDNCTSFYIYTPNIYQTDNSRMKFVKYLLDGHYITMPQVSRAINETPATAEEKQTLLNHIASHNYPHTHMRIDSLERNGHDFLQKLLKTGKHDDHKNLVRHLADHKTDGHDKF